MHLASFSLFLNGGISGGEHGGKPPPAVPSCQLALCFRGFPCKSVVLNLASRLGVSWICSLNCKLVLFLVSHARPSRVFGGPAALSKSESRKLCLQHFQGGAMVILNTSCSSQTKVGCLSTFFRVHLRNLRTCSAWAKEFFF